MTKRFDELLWFEAKIRLVPGTLVRYIIRYGFFRVTIKVRSMPYTDACANFRPCVDLY
jgi:hypothetical protein